MDLALLIKREHHRMVRRIDIEPDDVGEFRGKAGIARRLKVRRRCSCSLCARQMRWTEPCERPQALAIAGPVQWVAWCGGSVQVHRDKAKPGRVISFKKKRGRALPLPRD